MPDRRRIIGIDYSSKMCALACARGLVAHQANAIALPFADVQFDLVCSAEVVQCTDDLHGLLAEFARVCREGGRIVISTGNATSLVRRTMRWARRLKPHPLWSAHRPAILRTPAEMEIAVRDLPLQLEKVHWTYFPFPWLRAIGPTNGTENWAATNLVVCFIRQPAAKPKAKPGLQSD